MKNRFFSFLVVICFLLFTEAFSVFAGWEEFKNDEDKRTFLQKIFVDKNVDTLIIGGLRAQDLRNTHWHTAPETAVTVNIDPNAQAEFLVDGLRASDLNRGLAPLFQMIRENPPLRFKRIIYEHVQYAGLNPEKSAEELGAFQALMPLLAPGGYFIYQSYMDYLPHFMKEESTFYGYDKEWQKEKAVALEALEKDTEELKKMRTIEGRFFFWPKNPNDPEDEKGCTFIKKINAVWQEKKSAVEKFQQQISLFKELYVHCVETYGKDSFEALSCRVKFSKDEMALAFSEFYQKSKGTLLNTQYYGFSGLPVLQVEEKLKIDFLSDQSLYFQRTNLNLFFENVKRDLPLKDLEFSLNPGRVSYFYEISGIKKDTL